MSRLRITKALFSKAAKAVWEAEHPSIWWPFASDAERMRCFKRAANVLGIVKAHLAKRKKKA